MAQERIVDKRGRLQLGRAFVGRQFEVAALPDGDILLRALPEIPENERWLHEPKMSEADQVEDIEKLATRVFGNAEKAAAWLRKPMKRFAGKSPLEAAADESNAQAIRGMLYGLDHGYLD